MGSFQCRFLPSSSNPPNPDFSSQAEYKWQNTTANLIIADPAVTELNTYAGGALKKGIKYQPIHDFILQVPSNKRRVVSQLQTRAVMNEAQVAILSMDSNINLGIHDCLLRHPYSNIIVLRFDDGYISWINDGKLSWTVRAAGLGADPKVEISARPVPQEPMVYCVMLDVIGSTKYLRTVNSISLRISDSR